MNPQPLHKIADIRVAVECCVKFGNKILLQKRPDDKKTFPGFWTFPGGHVDAGEDALTAIIREVKEETGITILPENTKLKVSAINHHVDRNEIWIIYGFLAVLDKFEESNGSNEGECKWFEIPEAEKSDKIFPPIKYYFDHILNEEKGVLFMAAQWEKSQLIKLQSELKDNN